MDFAKPIRIRSGDRVRIVAPGGPFDLDSFNAGVEILKTRYEPKFDQSIFAVDRYLAGDDHRRHAELTTAFLEPDTKALFCARGGYGSMRPLPHVPVPPLPLKPLVGYSHMTSPPLAFVPWGLSNVLAPV